MYKILMSTKKLFYKYFMKTCFSKITNDNVRILANIQYLQSLIQFANLVSEKMIPHWHF